MPFTELNGLRYYTFPIFAGHPLVHGVFTRHGGVSPQPWDSLNQGGLSGDARENVIENRRRIFEVMGRRVESIFDTWLVHGTAALCADEPRPLDAAHPKADIIATDRPEITLFMRFADCVPIFLYDARRGVVAMAHAGWRGTVDGAAGAAVQTLQARYGSHPADILAAVGPSIGAHHYPVGADVIDAARAAFQHDADALLETRSGQTHFDLWAANRLVLQRAGVEQIEISGVCTACHTADWYSHRAEHGKTGRFGALLALRQA